MHESAMLERFRLRPFLLHLPRALMLLFAAVAFTMGRFSEPSAYDLAKATAEGKAYLHSGPMRNRTFVPDVGGAAPSLDSVRYEASGADHHPSSSDELATPELFGTNSDVA